MSTPGKQSKKQRKKPIPVKTSLNSPYIPQWQPLERDHMIFILNTLKEKLLDLGLQKKEVKVFRRWGKKKKKNESPGTDDAVSKPGPQEAEKAQTMSKDTIQPGWTDPTLRRQLAIGINEVTKGLERNDLALVLVSNLVKPSHMTCHLIPLSKTRSVPACQVPRLSENIAGLLGLKCVLAVGFKRDAEAFADMVNAIVPKVPSLDVAWVPTSARTQPKGEKRKRETWSDVIGEPSVSLQALKVKRIIPNPAKIRKNKIKSSKK